MAANPTPTLTQTLLANTMSTPVGPLTIVAADGRVCAGGFTDDLDRVVDLLGKQRETPVVEMVHDLGRISEALAAYFAGDLAALDGIEIDVQGGPFQERVWQALRQIRPGEPTTYRDLAMRLGGPQMSRAVGLGCATNRISPIVPCHRVTGTSGSLTGYLWGIEKKRWLLEHELRHA